MRVAVIVGHSKEKQGAFNERSGVTEFEFNSDLAKELEASLIMRQSNVNSVIVYRDELKTLPEKINKQFPDLVISLHCNAFDGKTSGCETLYYHESVEGKRAAKIFQERMVAVLDNRDRGILERDEEDRGGYILKYTNAPCLILEPFFIDKDEELDNAYDRFKKLADAIAAGIEEFFKPIAEAKKDQIKELEEIKNLIDEVLHNQDNTATVLEIKQKANKLVA